MVTIQDLKFLEKAIKLSQESAEQGNFPAGAIVVFDGKIISTAVSSPYPSLFHADSKATSEAFKKTGLLKNGSSM